MRRSPVLAASLCLLAGGAHGARAQGAHWELWPEVDAFVGVAPATRLLFLVNLTEARDTSYRQTEIGAYIDTRLLPHLSFRGGYSFLGAIANHAASENRGVVALTASLDGPGAFEMDDRNRLDLRSVGGAFSWRYRNRLRIDRPVHAVTPYLWVEVYYDFTKRVLNRIETQAGVEWRISRRVSIDAGLAHKNDRSASIDNVNALAITTTLNF